MAAEVQVQSLAGHIRLKDPVRPHTAVVQVTAVAWIQALDQKLAYDIGAAVLKKKKKKKKKKIGNTMVCSYVFIKK